MVKTCREIVHTAYTLASITSIDEEPTNGELNHGLEMLKSLYDGWFAAGEFGVLRDIYVTDDYTAFEGDRVIKSGQEIITLPDTYDKERYGYNSGYSDSNYGYGDYYYDRNRTRAAYELGAIEVVGVSRNIRELGDWINISELTADSPAPLVQFGMIGLAAQLAIDLAGTFGAEISTSTLRQSDMFKTSLRSKHISINPRNETVFF